MEQLNHFIATVKCGHVGRNKYIVKRFPITAYSKKEAAEIARHKPRVKHHWKDAIIDVELVKNEDYMQAVIEFHTDPYFKCKNIQDSRLYCSELSVQHRTDNTDEHNPEERYARIRYHKKLQKIVERQMMMA